MITYIKTTVTKDFERDSKGNLPYEEMDKGDLMIECFLLGIKFQNRTRISR
jgi:hypothetical protein